MFAKEKKVNQCTSTPIKGTLPGNSNDDDVLDISIIFQEDNCPPVPSNILSNKTVLEREIEVLFDESKNPIDKLDSDEIDETINRLENKSSIFDYDVDYTPGVYNEWDDSKKKKRTKLPKRQKIKLETITENSESKNVTKSVSSNNSIKLKTVGQEGNDGKSTQNHEILTTNSNNNDIDQVNSEIITDESLKEVENVEKFNKYKIKLPLSRTSHVTTKQYLNKSEFKKKYADVHKLNTVEMTQLKKIVRNLNSAKNFPINKTVNKESDKVQKTLEIIYPKELKNSFSSEKLIRKRKLDVDITCVDEKNKILVLDEKSDNVSVAEPDISIKSTEIDIAPDKKNDVKEQVVDSNDKSLVLCDATKLVEQNVELLAEETQIEKETQLLNIRRSDSAKNNFTKASVVQVKKLVLNNLKENERQNLTPNIEQKVEEKPLELHRGFQEFVSDDQEENKDNNNPDWEFLANIANDEERYKIVRKRWHNRFIPNPKVNASFYNWRKRNNLRKLTNINNNFFHARCQFQNSSRRVHISSIFDLELDKLRKNYDYRVVQMETYYTNLFNNIDNNFRKQKIVELKNNYSEDLQILNQAYYEKKQVFTKAIRELETVHKFYRGLHHSDLRNDVSVGDVMNWNNYEFEMWKETENMLSEIYPKFYQ